MLYYLYHNILYYIRSHGMARLAAEFVHMPNLMTAYGQFSKKNIDAQDLKVRGQNHGLSRLQNAL